jgi:mannitol-specific phosphotransferase system IIBC component
MLIGSESTAEAEPAGVAEAAEPITGDPLDDDVLGDDPLADKLGEPAPSRRGWRRWILGPVASAATAAVALALAVALVVTLVLLSSDQSRLDRLNSVESARSSALTAARTYSLQVASYNYRYLTQDFSRVERECTPSFAATYRQSSAALASFLRQYHAVATARVVAAGVASASPTRAVVIVFLDQTVTSTSQKVPTNDQSRLQLTLARSKSRWLIDQLKLL